MELFKIWLTSFFSFIVLDMVWIQGIARKFYTEHMHPIARLKANGSTDFHILPALLVYGALALAVSLFLKPYSTQSVGKFTALGGVLGLILYTVYDGTNLSFMNYWPTKFAYADLAWGAITFAITAFIVKSIFFK